MAFAELLAHPAVVEELVLGSRVGFLALHGGLEPGTAEIAREAAQRVGASSYAIVQPDDLKCHVPSHETDLSCAPRLAAFLDHVEMLVSVHGYFGRAELHAAVLVGGANRALAAGLASTLRAALPDYYRIVDDLAQIPRQLRGLDPRNPVNRAPGGGVQVELPHPVRAVGPYGAGPHAGVYQAHTAALVAALAAFAAGLAAALRIRTPRS
jgi:phage replication-related protein YjqB (UPF0714/DUF867 family)